MLTREGGMCWGGDCSGILVLCVMTASRLRRLKVRKAAA